jgi:ribosomal protein S18 acetylase RimI-like enzyme
VVSIRSIHPEEWQAYREVRLRALQESPDAFGSTYAVEAARSEGMWSSRVAAASTSDKDKALFALDNGQICGLAWCKVSATEPGVADLFQMWVAPGSRGRGAGTALLSEVVAFARSAGVTTLRLGVTVAESPAMGLYRSFGFRPVGDEQTLRGNSILMAQTMCLELNAANPSIERTGLRPAAHVKRLGRFHND